MCFHIKSYINHLIQFRNVSLIFVSLQQMHFSLTSHIFHRAQTRLCWPNCTKPTASTATTSSPSRTSTHPSVSTISQEWSSTIPEVLSDLFKFTKQQLFHTLLSSFVKTVESVVRCVHYYNKCLSQMYMITFKACSCKQILYNSII